MEPVSSIRRAKQNAELLLAYSTLYPFRIRGKDVLCVNCRKEFIDPNEFRNHMDEYHKTFTVTTAFAHCSSGNECLKVDLTNLKCSASCENLEEIAAHIRDVHGISQINTDFDLGMHPYRLNNEKWICAICDKKYASLIQLCRHTTSHYHKYTCGICNRTYLTDQALKYHTRSSHSGKNMCRKCWTDFPTLELKREHFKKSISCWPFCCTACGERFVSGEKRQAHLTAVHGLESRLYECPDCDLTFKSRRPFYNHFTLVHSDNSIKCPCCHLKFTSQKQMEEHKFSHTGNKPFRCDICSKTFSIRKNLYQHVWIHSENKRFVCVVCKKQFAQKVSLTGHLRSHHKEIMSNNDPS